VHRSLRPPPSLCNTAKAYAAPAPGRTPWFPEPCPHWPSMYGMRHCSPALWYRRPLCTVGSILLYCDVVFPVFRLLPLLCTCPKHLGTATWASGDLLCLVPQLVLLLLRLLTHCCTRDPSLKQPHTTSPCTNGHAVRARVLPHHTGGSSMLEAPQRALMSSFPASSRTRPSSCTTCNGAQQQRSIPTPAAFSGLLGGSLLRLSQYRY
jgi:hypothetical protein